MKLINLKLVMIVVAVGGPVVWAGLVLADRPSTKDSITRSARPTALEAEGRPSPVLARPLSRRAPHPVRFAPTTEAPAEPEASPRGSFDEEIAAEVEEGHDQERRFLQAFESQSVDQSWAHERESTLANYIDRDLGERAGFRDSNVECRSDKCLATVTWEDYGSAIAMVGTAADFTRGECATAVFMPPPDDLSATYTHKIRLGECVSHDGI